MKVLIHLVLFLGCMKGYCEPVIIDNCEDYIILDSFFKRMLKDSEYGYVLTGSKPISQMNISNASNLISPKSQHFKVDALTREAIRVWEKLNPTKTNFVLKTSYCPDQDCKEVIFVNIRSLRKVIDDNLDLFRYLLGPTIDTDKLLSVMIKSPQPLDSILGGNRVLIGIVLGFGTYNSLMHSRAEDIQDALLFQKTNSPLSFRKEKQNQTGIATMGNYQKKAFLLALSGNDIFHQYYEKHLKPNFGYHTLSEEFDQIMAKQDPLPEQLSKNQPRFIFGVYQSPKNHELIHSLKYSQDDTVSYLKSPHFLEKILEKITGEKPNIKFDRKKLSKKLTVPSNSEEALARNLFTMISALDPATTQNFISSFSNPDSNNKRSKHAMPGALKGLKLARERLKYSNSWFEEQANNEKIVEIIPRELQYEILKVGEGRSISQHNHLLISYVIEDGQQNVLQAKGKESVEVSNILPALGLALQGMNEGETRVIYIHPILCSGCIDHLPPGEYISAKITLHKIQDSKTENLSEVFKDDLSWIENPDFYAEIESTEHLIAINLGKYWGEWLRKSQDINFNRLVSLLHEEKQNLTQNAARNDQICNRIFWNIIVQEDQNKK